MLSFTSLFCIQTLAHIYKCCVTEMISSEVDAEFGAKPAPTNNELCSVQRSLPKEPTTINSLVIKGEVVKA